LKEEALKIVAYKAIWTRIDSGQPGAWAGAWLMSDRKRNGEMRERDTSRQALCSGSVEHRNKPLSFEVSLYFTLKTVYPLWWSSWDSRSNFCSITIF